MIFEVLVWSYIVTQILNYLWYIPVTMTIIKSPTADAVNVPAQLWFFFTGLLAAIYMVVINNDWLVFFIILLHITLGNLLQAFLAMNKQRSWKRAQNISE